MAHVAKSTPGHARRLVLRIRSGRIVAPEPVALTVEDIRCMANNKISTTESLLRVLLIQNAMDQIDSLPGTERFHDPEMDNPAWACLKARQRTATLRKPSSLAFASSHHLASSRPTAHQAAAAVSASPLSALASRPNASTAMSPAFCPAAAAGPTLSTNAWTSSRVVLGGAPADYFGDQDGSFFMSSDDAMMADIMTVSASSSPTPRRKRALEACSDADMNPAKLLKISPSAPETCAPLLSPTSSRDVLSVLLCGH